jgi:uncharacterized protein (TIGR02246 family)
MAVLHDAEGSAPTAARVQPGYKQCGSRARANSKLVGTAPFEATEGETMKSNRQIAGILASFAMLITPLGSHAADADAIQQLIDKSEIDTLLVDYTHALDTLDPDKYAGVFTEDAVFVQGQNNVRHGRDEIRSIIIGLIASREERQQAGDATPTLMHHVMTNATLEFVSDHEAHHMAYWMTILGGEDGYRVASMGHYEDVIVKEDGRWLIQSRKLLR